MSRSSAIATEPAQNQDNVSHEAPTRPLPKLTTFDLIAEARRLDAAARANRADEDCTVTIGAEENKRLLASVLAMGEAASPSPVGGPQRNPDDEATLDAPTPLTAVQLAAVQREIDLTPLPVPAHVAIGARPPALRTLVITRPAPIKAAAVTLPATPAALASSASGIRERVSAEVVDAAREARALAKRPSAPSWLPQNTTETYVVAGIWMMALSLIALLMVMVTSA